MSNRDSSQDSTGADRDEDGGRRRVRLHPREGREHRFRFARRWDQRRQSRKGIRIWALITIDIGAVALIYLLLRQLIERLTS